MRGERRDDPYEIALFVHIVGALAAFVGLGLE